MKINYLFTITSLTVLFAATQSACRVDYYCESNSDCFKSGQCMNNVCTKPLANAEPCIGEFCKAMAHFNLHIVEPQNDSTIRDTTTQVIVRLEKKDSEQVALPNSTVVKIIHKTTNAKRQSDVELRRINDTDQYQGKISFTNDGSYQLIAGFDEQTLQSPAVNIMVKTCDSECSNGFECIRKKCVPLYTAQITSPIDEKINNLPILIKATLQRTPETVKALPELPAHISMQAIRTGSETEAEEIILQKSENDSYVFEWMPDNAGQYKLVITSNGIESPAKELTVVPQIEIKPVQCNLKNSADPDVKWKQACRRDGVAVFDLVGTVKNIDLGSLKLKVQGDDSVEHDSAPASGSSNCGGKFCAKVSVNLWKPALYSLHGRFKVTAKGESTYPPIPISSNEQSVSVGRYAWTWNSQTNSPISPSLALSKKGNLYLTTDQPRESGEQIFALNAQGEQVYAENIYSSLGSSTPSAVLLNEDGNGPENGPSIIVTAHANDSGAVFVKKSKACKVFSSCKLSDKTAIFSPVIALSISNQGENGVLVGLANSKSTEPFGISTSLKDLDNGLSCSEGKNLHAITTHSSIATSEESAKPVVFAGGSNNLQKVTFNGASIENVEHFQTSESVTTVVLGESNSPVGIAEDGLFFGDYKNISLNGIPTGIVIGHQLADRKDRLVFTSAIDNAQTVISSFLEKQRSAQKSISLEGEIVGSPIIGKSHALYALTKAANSSTIYFVNNSLKVLWSAELPFAVSTPLTIDKNRVSDQSTTGIGYFGTAKGTVWGIIVDDAGLDTEARWPKERHDLQNTANVYTALE